MSLSKTVNRPDIALIVDWDVTNQHKRTKLFFMYCLTNALNRMIKFLTKHSVNRRATHVLLCCQALSDPVFLLFNIFNPRLAYG